MKKPTKLETTEPTNPEDRILTKDELDNLAAGDGRCILAIGPFCWGKAQTARAAIAKARGNFSPSYVQPNTKVRVVLYDADAETRVDAMGYIVYSTKKPIHRKVGETRWLTRSR